MEGQDRCMSDVPSDAYLLAILPFPAWPLHAAPGPAYEGAAAPLTPETLALALDASFPCFGEAGFVLGPADDWETQSNLILPLSRADATIFAVYTHGGLFFTAMAGGGADGTPLQQLRQAVRSHQQRATFGPFPLRHGSYDALVAALQPIGDALGSVAGAELAREPIDLAALDQAMAVALHALRSRLRIQQLRANAEMSWTEGRLKRVAEALTALASVAELTAEESERLSTAKAATDAEPAALVRREDEPAIDWYRRAAEVIAVATVDFKGSLSARSSSRAGRVAWENAVGHFHEVLGALWEDVYGRIYVPLQAGGAAAVDPAIEFLEGDLWYFRSGYFKEKLLRFLGRHPWTEEQRCVLRRSCSTASAPEEGESCATTFGWPQSSISLDS